ncbi:CAP domain-containing protein [Cellulomonas fengjieae]|uniref:SCP domain-containing protein n=1 Tax=Cellulomonas fengjieae TaxID=2819978 RepID=A0ABS3SMV0_9CELL|nr:CAP domain-containing protein [Cellulomonas fengjieae]MBO3086659.1 hypothetical protein [Cellulomonas fengjieae]QVI66493.1 hypothetical protein KG102_02475 [Cellulomonas fengjieae]
MHPFTPVPRSPVRRRDVRTGRGAGRMRWVRTAVLSAVCTLVLVGAPVALAPTGPAVTPSGDTVAERSPQRDDPAGRSGQREPTGTAPTQGAPTQTAPTETAPTDTAPTDTGPTEPAPTSDQPGPAPAVPVPAAPVPSAPQPAALPPSLTDQIVTRTNAERAAAGLAALTVSPCATEQAVARTALLVAENRFEHDPLEPILAACGARAVGENLALGYPTAPAVVAGWMGSEGHRANILNSRYTQIGVGCTAGPRGQLCAQVFMG